jgi:hypothetical protein
VQEVNNSVSRIDLIIPAWSDMLSKKFNQLRNLKLSIFVSFAVKDAEAKGGQMKLFLLLTLVSCTLIPGGRDMVTSKVQALSKDENKYSVKVVPSSETTDELKFEKYAKLTEQALQNAGYTISENPEVIVKMEFEIKDDFYSDTSTNLITGLVETDRMNQYVRIAKMRAYKGKKQIWSIEVTSVGSNRHLYKVWPYLMDAAIPYFGRNLDDSVTIRAPSSLTP